MYCANHKPNRIYILNTSSSLVCNFIGNITNVTSSVTYYVAIIFKMKPNRPWLSVVDVSLRRIWSACTKLHTCISNYSRCLPIFSTFVVPSRSFVGEVPSAQVIKFSFFFHVLPLQLSRNCGSLRNVPIWVYCRRTLALFHSTSQLSCPNCVLVLQITPCHSFPGKSARSQIFTSSGKLVLSGCRFINTVNWDE